MIAEFLALIGFRPHTVDLPALAHFAARAAIAGAVAFVMHGRLRCARDDTLKVAVQGALGFTQFILILQPQEKAL